LPGYPEILAEAGSRVLMLGNVAIARGALEYGIGYAAAYPGTPSTEIVESLSYASRLIGGPYVEWSTNEKVALESAIGAAYSGVPALASMKHVGVNVAADPLFSSAYTGVRAPLVVVSADDPGMWSSQNEQDNRWYGVHAYIPVVEPAGAQEAKLAAIEAFRLSEEFNHPVILRTTTRVGHTRVPVEAGDIDVEKLKAKGRFVKEPERTALVPANARRLREELISRWEKIAERLSNHPLNRVEGPEDARILVVGVGLGYRYARESLRILDALDKVRLLKISTPIPLPARLLVEEASDRDTIVFVEEGEPVVETLSKSVFYDERILVKIIGKTSRAIPLTGELTLSKVLPAIASALGVDYRLPEPPRPRLEPPPRPPVLCPGCPYRAVFYALRRAVGKARVRPIYSGDIGCYSLGILPPFRMQDTIVEMGGSIGLANGMSHVVEDQFPIAIIGDSTFFHSGIPGLANAVYNKAPMLIVVLDNRTTAMTGHQPHPGVGVTARGEETVELRPEAVAKALGIEYVTVTDAFDIKGQEKVFYEAIEYVKREKKPAMVVARGACILVALAEARRARIRPPVYEVVEDKCTGCGLCYKAFNCPAISALDNRKATVDPLLCTGCGECAQICPFDAFRPTEEPSGEWLRIMRTARPR